MKCPLCKQQIPDDSMFCECCGGKIPRCPTCNTVINGRMNFCEVDGTRIPDEINALFAARDEKTARIYPQQPMGYQGEKTADAFPGGYDDDATARVRPAPVGATGFDNELTSRTYPVNMDNSAYDGDATARVRPAPGNAPIPPSYSNQGLSGQYGGGNRNPYPGGYNYTPQNHTANQPKEEGNNKGLIILLVALLGTVLLLGAIVLIFMFGGSDDSDDDDYSSRRNTTAQTEPTEAPTVEPTEPEPVITYTYRYEIIQSDMTWEQAKLECERRGGYLATIGSQEEFDKIVAMAKQTDLRYLWVGAKLPYEGANWSDVGWIDGTAWTYDNWYPGEPSRRDTDGAVENYLSIWTVKNDEWTFNDQRNELVENFPNTSGRVGFVCEYKDEVRS